MDVTSKKRVADWVFRSEPTFGIEHPDVAKYIAKTLKIIYVRVIPQLKNTLWRNSVNTRTDLLKHQNFQEANHRGIEA